MMRLLHVEDDEDIREVAKMALELSGQFEVMQCPSGEDALEKAPQFKPEILLLDVMMPGMSGPTTLQKLREIKGLETTPAIFMTARAQPAEVEELKAMSALTVVVKPFDPITLGDQIMAALNG
ncbi:response regulator [Albibacillus kandeliae]|uniref:response regulator n=1 Tax=Albibacillus kandeliae TaxID=2174228 RepID=UPI000D69C88A|nr:response regulator [Albibacillus kandeliae]